MPGINPPSQHWLAQQLASLKREVAALKAQRTQYIVDASGNAQAIVGNVAADATGAPTGLSGWGVATFDEVWGSKLGDFTRPARAFRLAAQTINGWTPVGLDTASFNDYGDIDLTTGKFIAPVAGRYQVNGEVNWGTTTSSLQTIASIWKNGSEWGRGVDTDYTENSLSTRGHTVNDVVEMAAGDYIQLYAYSAIGYSLNVGSGVVNYMSVYRIA